MSRCLLADHPASRLSAAAAFLFDRMSTPDSPHLPGVPILQRDATGADYSRWRRRVELACKTKGTWGYCDGTHPMPMPKSQPETLHPRTSSVMLRSSLLDERRAWVRKDREVKSDIFLSLSEKVMEEVLDASPPFPPQRMNAQEMLAALDQHFDTFKFEDYHHTFCHFLNLHMDQYASIEDFNIEFRTTLEDLRDHGHPLSNNQACSAYFSKLRCRQNPWVVRKLENWDAQSPTPRLEDLMKESIPWTSRPSTSPSPYLKTGSISEELLESSSSQSDNDGSSISISSSPLKLHSRQTSNTTATTAHSLEITIHASSSDIAQVTSFPQLPATKYVPAALPCHLSSKKSIPLMSPPPPMNRPLPPLPKHILHTSPRARSASPRIMVSSNKTNNSSPKTSARHNAKVVSPPWTPSLRLETTHPTLRPKSPTLLDQKEFGLKLAHSPITPDETRVHPALRETAASSVTPMQPATAMNTHNLRTTPLLTSRSFCAEMNIAIPWPNTPDRPNTSRTDLTSEKIQREPPVLDALSRLRAMSGAGSTISLPLVGSRAVSPPRLQDRPLLKSTTTSPPVGSASPPEMIQSRTVALENLDIPSQMPTFESLGIPLCSPLDKLDGRKTEKGNSPVRELVTRLSGDSLEVKGDKDLTKIRKKSWSMGVSLGRFGPGKGVREIVQDNWRV